MLPFTASASAQGLALSAPVFLEGCGRKGLTGLNEGEKDGEPGYGCLLGLSHLLTILGAANHHAGL